MVSESMESQEERVSLDLWERMNLYSFLEFDFFITIIRTSKQCFFF
jgi:hypothetical protein